MATVNGPGSSTNNAVMVWDGTSGDTAKDSLLTVTGTTHPIINAIGAGSDVTLNLAPKGAGRFNVSNGNDTLIDCGSYGTDGASLWLGNNCLQIEADENEIWNYVENDAEWIIVDAGAIQLGLTTNDGVRIESGPTIVAHYSGSNRDLAIAGKGTGVVTVNGHRFVNVSSAVNEVTVTSATTINAPSISATGTDTHIGIQIKPKGLGGVLIGNADADVDLSLTFLGETNNGVLKWFEDEDHFRFQDDVQMDQAERLYFRDTGLFVGSSADGYLEVVADTLLTLGVAGDTTFGDGSLRKVSPHTDQMIDLGDATHRYNSLFVGQITITGKQTYAPTNVSTDRAYNANATTTDELADVLGTLIADLQTIGILG